MEYHRQNRTELELSSTKCYDSSDMTQECTAYLKTKLFMAKRIAEQQEEIELLKEQLIYHSTRHAQLYEIVKDLTEQINEIRAEKSRFAEESVNLSGELARSLELDEGKNTNESKAKKLKDNQNMLSDANYDKEKYVDLLKKENLDLRKDLENLKTNHFEKRLQASKLISDKFLLFVELNELVSSLKRIDIDSLNKFYINSIEKSNYEQHTTNVLSSLGIKYNILSAQSQMALICSQSNPKINLGQENRDYYHDSSSSSKILNYPKGKIELDQYIKLIKSFEEDLNTMAINDI